MPALRILPLVLLVATALGGAEPAPRWLTLDAAARRDPVDAPTSRLVAPGPGGTLGYRAEPDGTTLPDFSTCGFAGGGVALPVAAVKMTVSPEAGGGDDLARIQAAIDAVSRLPRDAQGLRGAVLLRRGHYRVHGTLRIAASGVVLRGEGPGTDGTVITATLPKKHTVIDVGGDGDLERDESTRLRVTDAHVPMGARTLQVERAGVFQVGDSVIVHRPSPREWIAALGMDRLAEGTKNPA